jgi:MFS transporter, MFS domain-containing protein family, molybdate-anion transporter
MEFIFLYVSDPRIILCGLSNALFQASFYIWLIEWTPTLQEAKNTTIFEPLPLGLIYASYLVGAQLKF